MSASVGYVYCGTCQRPKKPLGRSLPLEMNMCTDDCFGYRRDPTPDCRWPGEESCGPGCSFISTEQALELNTETER